MQSPPPPAPGPQVHNPLAQCLSALAGTADDSSWIGCQLIGVAQLVVDLVGPVSYASVTAYRDDALTTVAASSDIALAVDEAQYADRAGPCVSTLEAGSPHGVPDLTTTVQWPGFRDTASALGLQASLSIPLFAGRGTSIAALNLYSRQAGAMSGLIAAVRDAYDLHAAHPHASGSTLDRHDLDCGRADLLAGIAGAFAVRAVIQQAIGVVMADGHRTTDAAYLVLRLRAAETGVTLLDAAQAVIAEQQWK
jgi:hypothetical protein